MPYTQVATSYFGLMPKADVVREKLTLQEEMIRDSSAIMIQKHFKRDRVEYTLGREHLCV